MPGSQAVVATVVEGAVTTSVVATGTTDGRHDLPALTGGQLFPVYSVTKTLIAAAVMSQVAVGRVGLDDRRASAAPPGRRDHRPPAAEPHRGPPGLQRAVRRRAAHQLFDPLGLDRTRVAVDLDDMSALTAARTEAFEGEVSSSYHPGWVEHGLVLSTAAELAMLVDALLTGRLLASACVHRSVRF